MGRVENAVRNVLFGLFGNFLSLILGFVSRTILIKTLGLDYLGINGLYTNILSVLSLAELGIGTAVNYSLYKPVADKNYESIRMYMKLYKKIYRIIALVITAMGILILPFLKYIINTPMQIPIRDLNLYYLVFLYNTVSSYFVSYKFSLSNAEQKNYIQMNIQVVTSFITIGAQLIALVLYQDFLLYLIVGSIVGTLSKIYVVVYFKRLYPYLREKTKEKIPKQERKQFRKNISALLYHKIGDTSINQTDNIIISSFLNITYVAILSNYNLLINTINGFINIIFSSVVSGIGNMMVTENQERRYLFFKVYRTLGFLVFGLSGMLFLFLLTPFITLWLGNDYTLDNIVIYLIMADYYLRGHRVVINNFKSAAGIFDADKYISIIQAVANLVLSITFVTFFGLKGVFAGTLLSGLIVNLTKPFIVYRILFKKNAIYYYMDSLFYLLLMGLIYNILHRISTVVLYVINIQNILAMMCIIIVLFCILFFLAFRNREEYDYLVANIVKKYYIKLKKVYYQFYLKISNAIRKKRHNTYAEKNREVSEPKDEILYRNPERGSYNYSTEEYKKVLCSLTDRARAYLCEYEQKRKETMFSVFLNNTVYTNRKRTFSDENFRKNGLIVQSMEWSYTQNLDPKALEVLQNYFDIWINRGAVIDSLEMVLNGYTLIFLDQLIPRDKYKLCIIKIRDYIFSCPKDGYGSVAYKEDKKDDIYVETIGMLCPFLCRYGVEFNDDEAIQLAITQIINFIRYGMDPRTYLPYHGYNKKENIKAGIIGWGKSAGWLLIGLIDSLQYISCYSKYYKVLRHQFVNIVQSIIRYQKGNGSYNWQLTAQDGHVDNSATAMISYAIRRGVMLGVLNKNFVYHSNLGLYTIFNTVNHGEITDSSADSDEFGIYPHKYGTYPWAQGAATSLAVLSFQNNQLYRKGKNGNLNV